MKRIAVFASGSGSNAARLFDHFDGHAAGRVVLLCCNNPHAGVLQRAALRDIPVCLFDRTQLREGAVLQRLLDERIDWIVLAGFLWLVPGDILRAFPGRVINLHPALLPAYGGKGMYGAAVHRAVLQDGIGETGITIHLVNEEYDKGRIVFQARCPVFPADTVESLQERIHTLEHVHLPLVVERLIEENS